MDARYKVLYDFHKVGGPDATEERQWSFGVVLGLSRPYADDVPMDSFLYYYGGVNPHGQFRNKGDYSAFGFGWIFRS